jgi:hypothetical protein
MAVTAWGQFYIQSAMPAEDPVQVGSLWADTSGVPAVKVCTSLSPYTFSSVGGGGAPSAHATTHQNGGSDEINVVGLSGLLADAQTPLAHAASHAALGSDPLTLSESQITNLTTDLAAKAIAARNLTAGSGLTGGGDLSADRTFAVGAGTGITVNADDVEVKYGAIAGTAAQGDDSRLSDARTPTAHATSHQSGGSDAIKLDDLSAPDDNTDLNASTLKHGLLPKLSGNAAQFLDGTGAFSAPAASVNVKQTEIDFGATPIAESEFTVVDADVSATSQLMGTVAYEAPTGKDLDELEMDAIDLKFQPGTGQFIVRVKGEEGYLHDKFKINYLVG